MTKFTYLFGTILLASCVSSTQNAGTLSPVGNLSIEETSLASRSVIEIEIPKVDARPVDISPLVSNYLAARLSELEGRIADAAFFYDRAETADPQNKDLQEKAFSLQLALGNMEEAIRLAKSMITKKDPAPISYILLGSDALKKGEYEEAKRFFLQAKSISPMLIQFHVVQAYIDQAQGMDIEDIVSQIKDLPPMEGLTAVRHYHLGRLYEKAGMLDLATREYEFSLETDPESSFTIIALERVYQKTEKQSKIEYLYNAFMKGNPDNVMLDLSKDNYENNRPYIMHEPSLDEDVAGVVFELSTLMSAQRLQIAASQLIHTALMLDKHNEFFLFYKGMLEEQSGDIETAINTYNSIQKDQNTWMGGQIRIADILNNRGEHNKAIKIIDNLLKKHDRPILARILAEMYYTNEDYEKAIALYDVILKEQSAEKRADDFWMYFARGTAYERLQNYEKAEKDLKKSIAIQPNNPTALNYLGYMWAERGQHIDEAFNLIGRALLIRPNDAAILDSMGWVLFQKGEHEKAALYLEKAAEKKPTDATINMHLGDVYEKLGKYAEAHLHWQRALALEPESEKDIEHIRSQLKKMSAKLKN